MMKIIVYYHNDMDGKCSAAIVKHAYGDRANIEFVPLMYDDDVELPGDIWAHDRVYILDFTLPKRQMDELCTLLPRKDVIWIEHHVTQLVKYEDKYSHFEGIRKNGTASSNLTWKFMYGQFNEPPPVVRCVSNMDLWKKDNLNDVHLYEWLITYMGGPQDAKWDSLFQRSEIPYEMIERGQVLRNSRINQMQTDVLRAGYESDIDGHKCFKVNYSSCESISDAGRFICDELGYKLAWIYHARKNNDGKLVRVNSLRGSDEIDVSEIAMKYGGGGHKEAAGFVERLE